MTGTVNAKTVRAVIGAAKALGLDGESIGIDAAERLPWGHFEVIDYLAGTSDNLGTALRRFERYFAIVSTGVAHVLEEHADRVSAKTAFEDGIESRVCTECSQRLRETHVRIAPSAVPLSTDLAVSATPVSCDDVERSRSRIARRG